MLFPSDQSIFFFLDYGLWTKYYENVLFYKNLGLSKMYQEKSIGEVTLDPLNYLRISETEDTLDII